MSLSTLVYQPASICASWGNLVARRDGRVGESLLPFVIVCFAATEKILLCLDTDGFVYELAVSANGRVTVMGSPTLRSPHVSPPALLVGQSVLRRSGQIVVIGDTIFWRLDMDIADMSLDQTERRWRSGLGCSRSTTKSVPSLVSIFRWQDDRLLTLHCMGTVFELRTEECVLASHSGVAVTAFLNDNEFFVVTETSVCVFTANTLNLVITVPMPPKHIARINPSLNVFRKFAQVQTPLSISLGIQHLPLVTSGVPTQIVKLPRTPRWTVCGMFEGNLWLGNADENYRIFGMEPQQFAVAEDDTSVFGVAMASSTICVSLTHEGSLNFHCFNSANVSLYSSISANRAEATRMFKPSCDDYECPSELIVVAHTTDWVLLSDGTLVGGESLVSLPVTDPTCFATNGRNIAVGTFEGDLFVFGEPSCHFTLPDASIHSVLLAGEKLVAGTRSGRLVVFDVQTGTEIMSKQIGVMPVTISAFESTQMLVWCESVFLLSESLDLISVPLGSGTRVNFCLPIVDSNKIAVIFGENHMCIFTISINAQQLAQFTNTLLPFKAEVLTIDSTMYCIGQVEKTGHKALFSVMLDPTRIGALMDNSSVAVAAVLPFNPSKEEPVCMAIWQHELFPSGLIAVGTKSKSKGRLILFERGSLTAIAKTGIPSLQVTALCAMSSSVIALGCTDCVVLIGLRSMLPFTIASFTTYISVKHITCVSETEILIVTENGLVNCIALVDTTLASAAQLESPMRIVSACTLIPHTRHFVCSNSDGLLLMYNIDGHEKGTMTLLKSWNMYGAILSSACKKGDSVILGFSNGALHLLSTQDKFNKLRMLSSST